MLEKIKRSIEEMPRPAYIFLIHVLRLCCLMLGGSLLLFLSAADCDTYERIKLAYLLLETPSGILLVSVIGFAFLIDRCQ